MILETCMSCHSRAHTCLFSLVTRIRELTHAACTHVFLLPQMPDPASNACQPFQVQLTTPPSLAVRGGIDALHPQLPGHRQNRFDYLFSERLSIRTLVYPLHLQYLGPPHQPYARWRTQGAPGWAQLPPQTCTCMCQCVGTLKTKVPSLKVNFSHTDEVTCWGGGRFYLCIY